MARQVFYKDEDASFEYEVSGSEVLVHCDVNKWTPSVIKKGYRVLGDFMNTMRKQGLDTMVTITPNPKFAKLFGGRSISHIIYEEKEYEVVVWGLK
jgi:hypothetical protein